MAQWIGPKKGIRAYVSDDVAKNYSNSASVPGLYCELQQGEKIIDGDQIFSTHITGGGWTDIKQDDYAYKQLYDTERHYKIRRAI